MAKSATKAAEKKAAPAKEEWKYGMDWFSKELGIQPASVRVAFRKHKIKKGGKSYGCNSLNEAKAIVDQVKADTKKKAA